ncbi:MAG TPA: M48 family metalloprotease [Gammaproteobacteria bacterium]|nr:M48 family metalloprotease [Gammaproteobacteria bacterium]
MRRWLTFAAAALLIPVLAEAAELPDFGSPADAALSKSREAQIGRGVMLQLRNAGVIVDDPFLEEYVSTIGSRLATHVNDGDFNFNFFVVQDDAINAFALPGGYIGVNSGLLLASESEDELAGVLAHEISHVTQRHLARGALDNQRTSIVSLAAMLAALVLGAASDMPSDAMTGIVAASQGLAAQRQINFTRANESEADRVGIELMSGAGFDPNGMSSFFEKLSRRYGGTSDIVPEILRTHPVSTERVAEARDRVRQLPAATHTSSPQYALAKSRLIVLSAARPEEAFGQFRDKADSNLPEDRYGLALASMRMSLYDNAEALFRGLVADYPSIMAFRVGQAEAMAASGATQPALGLYADAIRLFPRNGPLTTSYAEALIAAGKPAEAHEVLLDLLNNVPPTASQLRLIARAANAEGDVANAYFYMSYYYASIGNLPLAIGQVRMALETPNANDVDRARVRSRLDQLIEYLPDEQRHLANGPQ